MIKVPFEMEVEHGKTLYGVHWPADNPRALVLIVHGLGEHIMRYEHLAKKYTGSGIAVAGFDHPGHGNSYGRRGHAPDIDGLLANVASALDSLRHKYSDKLPVFIHSQSMGGNIALHFGLKYPESVSGIIASSPWIGLAFPDPAFKVALGRMMKSLWPAFTLPSGIEPRKISRSEAVVKAYVEDPLVHDKISAGLGIGILEAARTLQQFEGDYPVPLLLMHGASDGLTSPRATAAFAARAGGDVTFREWPEAYHELHNEPEQDDVFRFGLRWIEERL